MNPEIINHREISRDQHGGDINRARLYYGKKKFLDLSININPWGPPFRFWFSLMVNLGKIREYPQPYSENGREILARFFDLPKENFLLGNGAAELISALPQALTVNRAIVLEPTFSEYSRSFEAAGKPVLKINLTSDFKIPLARVKSEINEKDLLFICQPNNPNGKLFENEELLELIKITKSTKSWLVIDESFLWFCKEIKASTFARFIADNPSLIIINSLTKIAAIPGLRLGFLVASLEVTSLFSRTLNQWNLNSLAQQGISAILEPNFLSSTRKRLIKENSWLRRQMAGIKGIDVCPGDANFLLFKVTGNVDGMTLIAKLAEHGILVRDCNNFIGLERGFIRVAVAKRRQNRYFIKVLKDILANE